MWPGPPNSPSRRRTTWSAMGIQSAFSRERASAVSSSVIGAQAMWGWSRALRQRSQESRTTLRT